MEGQELIKRAGNILQLTIKKSPAPMSPQGSYGSQVTAQLHDGPMSPSSRQPKHVQFNSYPATHTALPDGSTRIQIQRSVPAQQSSGPPLPPTPKAYEDTSSPFGFDQGRMPDYTIPYKQTDSGGGAYDGYRQPQQNAYSAGGSMSLPRGVGYGDRGQEPRSLPINYTGQPSASSQPQPVKFNPTQAYESRIGSSRQPDPLDEISGYTGGSSAFSPTASSQPFTRIQVNSPQYSEPSRPTVNSYSSSPYSQQQQQQQPASYGRPQQSPMSPTSSYSQQPSLQRGYSQEQQRYGQEPQRYGQEPQRYGQEPQRYGQEPQRYGQEPHRYGQETQRGYGQEPQQPSRGYYDSQPARGSYESAMSPQQSYKPQYQQPQHNSYGGQNSYQPSSYGAPASVRPEAPPSYAQTFPRRQPSYDRQPSGDRSQPSQPSYGGQPAYDRSQQDDGYVSNTVFNAQQQKATPGVSDFGYEEPAAGRGSQGPQGYRAPEPYRPAEPMRYEPQPGDGVFEARPPYGRGSSQHDSQPLSPGVRSVQPDFSAPGRATFSPQRDAAPPPPPPPGPGASWTPSRPVTAPSVQSRQQQQEGDGQKVPDELLSTVLKSKGGAKPFSYGVDLNELKKKIGPPTAPKTVRKKQASPARGNEPDNDMYTNKTPAGFVQSDYRRKADEGPRSEIDTSPINIHMGANPKKQSMSFKVLQWMTDTENTPDDDPEPAPTRTRRPQRDPTVHNADDDEMRFSGLHSKADIPSRAFKHLQKIPAEAGQNHAAPAQQGEEWDDGLPDTLSPEDATDKRYKGGNIPSKVFKTLQKVVGDDTPDTPPSEQQNGNAAPAPARAAKAPSQETATDF